VSKCSVRSLIDRRARTNVRNLLRPDTPTQIMGGSAAGSRTPKATFEDECACPRAWGSQSLQGAGSLPPPVTVSGRPAPVKISNIQVGSPAFGGSVTPLLELDRTYPERAPMVDTLGILRIPITMRDLEEVA
jgi:hypothetical protein